ncbi:MAG: hypothetical protein ACTS41_01215 [Candidatus Hodgkinia cicadicola]
MIVSSLGRHLSLTGNIDVIVPPIVNFVLSQPPVCSTITYDPVVSIKSNGRPTSPFGRHYNDGLHFIAFGRSPRPHQSMSSRDAALVVYFCAAIVRSP